MRRTETIEKGYPGRLTVFASASLLVGGEVVHKMAALFRELIAYIVAQNEAAGLACKIDAVEGGEGKDVLTSDVDALAAALESKRLSVRYWHDNNTFSRMQIVAPNPATARGFTGSVVIDEFGWIRDLRDVWDAMEPILSSDPSFTCLLATTPPADDTHYSYEMLVPPPGTNFEVNPIGNWYTSQAGFPVHRVDAWDGDMAGAKFVSLKTGRGITPEEHRATAIDRESWERNYGLRFITGGQAALSRLVMDKAQGHPLSACCLAVDDGEELPDGWADQMADGQDFALGLDIATTTNQKSNYTSLAVAQKCVGLTHFFLVWRWKSGDPEETIRRVKLVLQDLRKRFARSPRGLALDASSELFFAVRLRESLRDLVHVTLIKNGETLAVRGEKTTYKQYLGDLYTNELDDGRVVLPAARWLFEDHRLVKKEKGSYGADVGPDGCHADSFDGNKLAMYALEGVEAGGAWTAADLAEVTAGGMGRPARTLFHTEFLHL